MSIKKIANQIEKKKIATKAKSTPKDKIEIVQSENGLSLKVPELKKGNEITVGFINKARPNGFDYVKAFILEKCPIVPNQTDCYLVSFGKNSKRGKVIIPITNIHSSNIKY